MGWQATDGPWAGGTPGQDPGLPEPPGLPGLPAGFEHGGPWAEAAPSAGLAAALQHAAGPAGLYDGAGTDALVGIARQWAAVESWAAAGKLAALRAMTREDADGEPLLRRRAGLPAGWDDSLTYEISGALAMGPVSAGNLASLAWTLGTRLAGVGALLAHGTLTLSKARLVAQLFEPLDDGEAARAEALILDELPGKTYFQVERLAWRAALAVAPDVAERRRTAAERHARVTVFREEAGTAGLSGRDLPAAEALAGHASVLARAAAYRASGAFSGQADSMLQAQAYLDLLNGVSARDRIAFTATATAGTEPPGPGPEDGDGVDPRDGGDRPDEPDDGDGTGADPRGEDGPRPSGGPRPDDSRGRDAEPPGGPGPDTASPDGRPGTPGQDACGHRQRSGDGGDRDQPAGDRNGGNDQPPHSDNGRPDPGNGEDDPDPPDGPGPGEPVDDADGLPDRAEEPRTPAWPLAEVTVPLATLQHRAERAGDSRLLGPLDPALARHLAAAAARSPASRWELTIVDEHGHAAGHGIARPARTARGASPPPPQPRPQPPPGPVLPARVNITITEDFLHHLETQAAQPARAAQPRPGAPPGDWALTPGNPGTWVLTLPGGQRLTVRFDVVPTHACDHRYRVSSYLPGDRLRRLIQVRDHTCTWPPCSRPARDSDFEHAVPHDKGGATDACNAGARSRRCHQVKQLPGWTLTQPKPGWHLWTTPTGRSYLQEPWRYTA